MPHWNDLLILARRGVGLSQRRLSELAGMSLASIKSYELGRRKPNPDKLHRLLDTLNVDWRTRNAILVAIGFAPHLRALGGRTSVERYMTLSEAAQAIESKPWPSLVLNEMLDLLAINRAGLRILGIKTARLSHPVRRNMLTMATEPIIASRLNNWEQLVGGAIALFKAHVRRTESLEHPSSSFSAVLARVYEGDPRLVRRFIDLWESTPGEYPAKMAWEYDISFDVPPVGLLNFRGQANSVNEIDGLDIDDWMPSDSLTFCRLERLLSHAD